MGRWFSVGLVRDGHRVVGLLGLSGVVMLSAGREWRIGIDFCMAGGFASLCLAIAILASLCTMTQCTTPALGPTKRTPKQVPPWPSCPSPHSSTSRRRPEEAALLSRVPIDGNHEK